MAKRKAKEVKRITKYADECPICGAEFIFTNEDIIDRLVTCPKCGHKEIFIKANYK